MGRNIGFNQVGRPKKLTKRVTEYEGILFDSSGERDRYIELKELQKKKKISHLELQKEFELIPKQIRKVEVQLKRKVRIDEFVEERACMYTCDFYYYDCVENVWVVEEVKSKYTVKFQDYIIRRKLMKYIISKKNEEGSWEKHVFRETLMMKSSKSKQSHKKKGVKGCVYESARIK